METSFKKQLKMSEQILNTLNSQRSYFASGDTKDVAFRIDKLKQLKEEISKNEEEHL